jgi:hypothetical protein
VGSGLTFVIAYYVAKAAFTFKADENRAASLSYLRGMSLSRLLSKCLILIPAIHKVEVLMLRENAEGKSKSRPVLTQT